MPVLHAGNRNQSSPRVACEELAAPSGPPAGSSTAEARSPSPNKTRANIPVTPDATRESKAATSSAAAQHLEGVNKCSVCLQHTDQQLQIQCDTCTLHYHLCCLDPPLTRMPKKTKQMGWWVHVAR